MQPDLHKRYLDAMAWNEATFGKERPRPTYEEWLENMVTLQARALDNCEARVETMLQETSGDHAITYVGGC